MADPMDELEESWWESLTDDERASVLAVDFSEDVPGWIVASLVAAHSAVTPAGDDREDNAADIRPRVVQRLEELVAKKRGT